MRVPGSDSLLSEPLLKALEDCFERGEQALLFLNRRGKAQYVQCEDCGHLIECPNCDLKLSLHLRKNDRKRLLCHACNHQEELPERCPSCGSTALKGKGVGTQAVAKVFERFFPGRTYLRLDQDVSQSAGGAAQILQRFAEGEADCLIGTQMVAKGHDFERLTLVGILAADQLLAIPDYRANERAFQLLTQCAGRAGRHRLPGQVFIQTFQPEHPLFQAVIQLDEKGFADEELAFRAAHQIPPYCWQGLILLTGPDPESLAQQAQLLSSELMTAVQTFPKWSEALTVFPAMPAPVFKINQNYRYRIILKSRLATPLYDLLGQVVDRQMEGISVSLDVNPVHLT